MKKLFVSFCKKNLASAHSAILSQLEYRFNFITDALLQPIIIGVIEVSMWMAIFEYSAQNQIGGFSRESYLAYALWAAFISRISANWMYEFRMVQEIDTGSVNSILVRPISFYEYYLSQFLGYKFITTVVSLLFPIAVMQFFKLPFLLERLPLALVLIAYNLIFVFTLSFLVACLAFFLNRTHSFTVAKNFIVWILSGEIIPLDLLPQALKSVVLNLPFANNVFVPVGYITGRIGTSAVYQGFLNTTLGILVISSIAFFVWQKGRKIYSGTGA